MKQLETFHGIGRGSDEVCSSAVLAAGRDDSRGKTTSVVVPTTGGAAVWVVVVGIVVGIAVVENIMLSIPCWSFVSRQMPQSGDTLEGLGSLCWFLAVICFFCE